MPQRESTSKLEAFLLCAGLGTRLKPLTDEWPKCLMPVSGRPLIDYWLVNLKMAGFQKVFVNTHWKDNIVQDYLKSSDFGIEVVILNEEKLLGTAGSLRNLAKEKASTILLDHGDNYSDLDLPQLVKFHRSHSKPISMVTFKTANPRECGIVVHNRYKTVTNFYEKVEKPPSNLANAAVYMIDKSVIKFIQENERVTDFSNHVIPAYLTKIKAFHHTGQMIDIGSLRSLKYAQTIDSKDFIKIRNSDRGKIIRSPIFEKIKEIVKEPL